MAGMASESLQTNNRRRRAASWCMLLVAVIDLLAIFGVKFRNQKREQFVNTFSPHLRRAVRELLQKGESEDQIKDHLSRYVQEAARPRETTGTQETNRTPPAYSYSGSGLKYNEASD